MSLFYVDIEKLNTHTDKLKEILDSIKECKDRINHISDNLSDIGLAEVIPNIEASVSRLLLHEKKMNDLSNALIAIVKKYNLAEMSIINQCIIQALAESGAADGNHTGEEKTCDEPEEGTTEYIYNHLSDKEYFSELLSKDYSEITEEEIIAMSMYFDQCMEYRDGEYVVDCDKLAELMESMYNADTKFLGLLGSNLDINEYTMAPIIDSVITYRTANMCNVNANEVQASILITDSLYAARMCYHNIVCSDSSNPPDFTINIDENGVYTISTDIENTPDVTISAFTGEPSDLAISNYRWERISTSDSELNFVIQMPDDTGLNVNQYNYTAEQYTYMCSETAIHIPAHINFLDRNTCVLMAQRAILDHGANGEYAGMDQIRIAKELYAHDYMYYTTEWAGDTEISHHASVADINLGDGVVMEGSFSFIWELGCLSDVTYK